MVCIFLFFFFFFFAPFSWPFSTISYLLLTFECFACLSRLVVFAGVIRTVDFGTVAQSDARSTGDQEGVSSRLRSGNILSLRLIMKIFSTVILSLPLIQERKLSVTCERMCIEYWLIA